LSFTIFERFFLTRSNIDDFCSFVKGLASFFSA